MTGTASAPEDILARLLADEIRSQGLFGPLGRVSRRAPVRHRLAMGAGSTHVMLWSRWAGGRLASERRR